MTRTRRTRQERASDGSTAHLEPLVFDIERVFLLLAPQLAALVRAEADDAADPEVVLVDCVEEGEEGDEQRA